MKLPWHWDLTQFIVAYLSLFSLRTLASSPSPKDAADPVITDTKNICSLPSIITIANRPSGILLDTYPLNGNINWAAQSCWNSSTQKQCEEKNGRYRKFQKGIFAQFHLTFLPNVIKMNLC